MINAKKTTGIKIINVWLASDGPTTLDWRGLQTLEKSAAEGDRLPTVQTADEREGLGASI